MPEDPDDLEEVEPDLYFLDPTHAPAANHPALASPPVLREDNPSSAQVPAIRDSRPSSTQLPGVGSPQNQRRHLRFRIEDAVAHMYAKGLLTVLGLGRVNAARAAVNVSEGGMLLLASERFKPGTRVHVRIELEKVRDALECDGIVRWSAESARNPGRFFVGVQFENLPATERSKVGAMRTWFTSREYKLKYSTRRRMKGPQITTDS